MYKIWDDNKKTVAVTFFCKIKLPVKFECRRDNRVYIQKNKKRKPTSPRVTIHIERAYTYRRLFLPHFNIFSLCLGEVIPNFLVTGCSKYPFDLTDCWRTQELHVAYKNTTNPRCIPDLIASHTIDCTHKHNSFVLSFLIPTFIHSFIRLNYSASAKSFTLGN